MSTNDFDNLPNPYQASAPLVHETPPLVQPVSLTVFGILNIVWGLLGLCLTGIFTAQVTVVTGQSNVRVEAMSAAPVYFGYTMLSIAVGFVATIALIVGGIGLLSGKPYGRKLSLAFAVYGIVFGLLGLICNFAYLLGPMIDQVPAGPQKTPTVVGMIVGMSGAGVCSLIYPIVLLIFMMRAPVIHYMRAQQQHA